ncbi:MAG: transglutaminase family protein, partial [Fibrobacterales bacterium]|nr:transglutaminase family protein [Fibrobacterales bacterium]
HFATLAALLLRSRGIPTRYAKGWLPGERMGSGCAVRRIAAHSWTLVWNGEAWIQRDFTPPAMLPKAKTGKIRLLREKLNAKIGEFKLFLFHGAWRLALEEGANRWQTLLVPGEVLAFLLVLLLLLRRRRRLAALTEAQRLWAKAERLLRAEGISVGKGETVSALLNRLGEARKTPRTARAVSLLEEYQRVRWR